MREQRMGDVTFADTGVIEDGGVHPDTYRALWSSGTEAGAVAICSMIHFMTMFEQLNRFRAGVLSTGHPWSSEISQIDRYMESITRSLATWRQARVSAGDGVLPCARPERFNVWSLATGIQWQETRE